MRRRFQSTLLLACMTTVMMAGTVSAQEVRPERGFYIYPKIGLTQYTGDRDPDLSALFDNYYRTGPGEKEDEDGFPFGAGLELGYAISPSFSLGGELHYGFFPTADDQAENDDWQSYGAKLIGRYTFMNDSRVAPFLEGGLFGHTGVEEERGTLDDPGLALGPLVGLGLDFAVSKRASIMLELQNMISVPDVAFDGVSEDNLAGGEEDFQRFDLINFLSLGLKYSFAKLAVAPDITDLDCPETVTAGQTATFRAELNEEATEPVDLRWDFGTMGATGAGTSTSYTFTTPGTYTVTATAMNEAGENVETCVVNVLRAPVNAVITGLTASPSTVCVGESVSFSANVTGDEPYTYRYDFGNGQTATGAAPTFTFDEAGTYTVTLTTTGATGVATTRTTTVRVEECDDCAEEITELNSVYFPRNSSTLTAEGRAALGENLELLRECPELCVRLEGWASAGERNPQQLSEDRARAVAQFYQENGIAASRIAAVGMGVPPGETSKKEGGAQMQRVDSIPVPCEDLND